MQLEKDRPKPKFEVDQYFDYGVREEIFYLTERFWSYNQKCWMYTAFYPNRPVPEIRRPDITTDSKGESYDKCGQYRRYSETRLENECSRLANQTMAKVLYDNKK